MAISAELKGREALMRRLNELAPNVEKYTADAKLKAAEQLAEAIRDVAPVGASLQYRESISGDFLKQHAKKDVVGITPTKDPSATGIFGEFIWRFLEFGTAPHNTSKGGGTALGRAQHTAGGGTQHPGTRAQPHVFPTYRAMQPKIVKMIRAAVNKAVREAIKK